MIANVVWKYEKYVYPKIENIVGFFNEEEAKSIESEILGYYHRYHRMPTSVIVDGNLLRKVCSELSMEEQLKIEGETIFLVKEMYIHLRR